VTDSLTINIRIIVNHPEVLDGQVGGYNYIINHERTSEKICSFHKTLASDADVKEW
jgi:hypothetical protein